MAVQGRSGGSNALTALRYENERRILKALLESEKGLTQRELSATTGLARNTVSALLGERLAGYVRSIAIDSGERGAPPKRWTAHPEAAFALGVDIGKTRIAVLLLDATGDLAAPPQVEPIPDVLENPEHTLTVAGEMIAELLGSRARCRRVAGVMVGLPGATDAEHGRLIDPAAPRWEETDVLREVDERWPHGAAPVPAVENDANLGALGEYRRGAGRGVDSLIYVKWATGIGAGIILDGKLWTGKRGLAGEIGHLPVHLVDTDQKALRAPPYEKATPCPRCNHRRCLENVAGGPVLAEAFDVEDFDALIALSEVDDVRGLEARRGLKAAARVIGTAIGPTLSILNVERVVLGGTGGVRGPSFLFESIEEGVEATSAAGTRSDVEIRPTELEGLASAWGGALTALTTAGPKFILEAAIGSFNRSQTQPKRKPRPSPAPKRRSRQPVGN